MLLRSRLRLARACLLFGLSAVMLHGAGCSEADSASEPGSERALSLVPGTLTPLVLSVWGSGDKVWFAGGEPGENGGLVARLDGERIVRDATPPGRTLWWIWGTSADELWACGEGGRILARRAGRWESERSGLSANVTLWGVWGSSPTDLWAVGGSPMPQGEKGVVLRSDGSGSWRRVSDPLLPESNLYKVWGSGPNDVHIVGEAGVALHFDGARFERVPTGTSALLFTVHGQAGGPVLAVGGNPSGVILRWDGSAWSHDNPPLGTAGLNGVFVLPDGSAIVTGAGVVLKSDASKRWSALPTATLFDSGDEALHAVWSGADVWAVGGDVVRASHGLIATTRRPLPVLAIDPAPDASVLDANDEDAGGDASEDVTSDAPADASVDAFADALADNVFTDVVDSAMDAADSGEADAATLPGKGEECPSFQCSAGLECWTVFDANFTNLCMEPCSMPSDCAGYGANPCCIIPGPQLTQTYCVPSARLSSGCP